jgi:hypothetical protein
VFGANKLHHATRARFLPNQLKPTNTPNRVEFRGQSNDQYIGGYSVPGTETPNGYYFTHRKVLRYLEPAFDAASKITSATLDG